MPRNSRDNRSIPNSSPLFIGNEPSVYNFQAGPKNDKMAAASVLKAAAKHFNEIIPKP